MTSNAFSADPIASNKKTILYVGGLSEEVDERVFAAAFRPFGELKQVLLPKEANSNKTNRGFGFVEFIDADDAAAALENMHDSELYGRVLKCNLAKPASVKSNAIWAAQAQAEGWYESIDRSAQQIEAQQMHQANIEARAQAQ